MKNPFRPVCPPTPRILCALGALPLLVALGACSRPQAADELIADARRYRDRHDPKAAIIQLKNVVQQQPEHGAARLMLGQMYLETGDLASAEKELRRARDLGEQPAAVQAALGKTLLLQGQFQRVLDEIPGAPTNGEVQALRGQAMLGLNRADDARALFQQALRIKPGLAEATLGLAKVALLSEQPEQATRLVDEAIRQDPGNVDPLRLKGDLQRAGNDPDAARKTYEQILDVNPNNVQAHVDLANLAIEAGRFDEARAQIKLARKAQPNNLLIFYSQALLEFREQHFKAALDQVQLVLRSVPDHMPSVLLAGAVSAALGSDTQAEQYLSRFLQANPGHPYATKALATVALRNGRQDDALNLIRSALKASPDDAEMLALAGEAEMRSRRFEQAAAYFEKASALKPELSELRLGHGLSRLAMGERSKAIPELERAAAGGRGAERAGVLLVLSHLRGKQFDKAIEVVDAMIAKGDSAMLQNLRGGVLLGRSDVDGARAGFMRALALDPLYLPALDNLANLDIVERKPDEARKRYEAALAQDKKNVALMNSIARLETRVGKPADAARWLEQASREDPDAKAPSQQLINHYLRTGEKQKALTLAQKLQATDTTDAAALALLAQAQELNQQDDAALDSYERLAVLQPTSAAAPIRIVNLHLGNKRLDDALLAARKAVKADPDSAEALILLNALLIEKNATREALAATQAFQTRHPDVALGFKLEGDVFMAQQKPGEALQRYQRAFDIAPASAVVIALHRALLAAGKHQEASAKVRQWLDKQPGDVNTRIYYASMLIAENDYQGANKQYEEILKSAPDNPVTLNDYAWSLLQVKDPRALAHAEKAYKLAPKVPAIADTLAAVLLANGDTASALPLLRKAVEQAPAANEIRLRLAEALFRSGDRKGAKAQCEQLLGARDFKRQADVRALMAKL